MEIIFRTYGQDIQKDVRTEVIPPPTPPHPTENGGVIIKK